MYSVGDKVVHPGYGPGIVKAVERRQVIGDAKDYYIIRILTQDATLMTPVARADEIGLRPAISADSVEQLFQALTEPPESLSSDFRERQDAIEERLKEGDVFAAAGVIRDMTWHAHINDLTKRDTQLLQQAEERVGGELALIHGIEVEEAIAQLHQVLAEVISTEEEGEN